MKGVKNMWVVYALLSAVFAALTSILAKVARDRYMRDIDEKYPEYGFKDNKGYGSAKHIEALKTVGPCPIHRKSFIKHFVNE